MSPATTHELIDLAGVARAPQYAGWLIPLADLGPSPITALQGQTTDEAPTKPLTANRLALM